MQLIQLVTRCKGPDEHVVMAFHSKRDAEITIDLFNREPIVGSEPLELGRKVSLHDDSQSFLSGWRHWRVTQLMSMTFSAMQLIAWEPDTDTTVCVGAYDCYTAIAEGSRKFHAKAKKTDRS